MKLCKDCKHYQVEPMREANGMYGDGIFTAIRMEYFCMRHPAKIDLVTGERVIERKRCYAQRAVEGTDSECDKSGRHWEPA